MQSFAAPRRRQARAAVPLALIAAALAAYLILVTPAQAAHSGSITSSYILRGPMSDVYSLILTGSAGVYAVGSSHEHNIDVLISRNTLANKNRGHFTWSNPAKMNGVDAVNAVAGDRFGNIVVAGMTETRDYPDWDMMVLKVTPCMELQWAVVLDGGDQLSDIAKDVVCDRAGNAYVTGTRTTAQGSDFWTMKLAARDGAIVWQAFYDSGLDDGAGSLCRDAFGNVYVAGSSRNPEGDREARGTSDLVTVKYNRSGAQQWVTRTDSPLHHIDSPRAIALGRSGALFVGGEAWKITGTLQQRLWVVRITTDGHERWQRTLDMAPWKDSAWAFRVSKDNHTYLAGYGYKFDDTTQTSRGIVACWNGAGRFLWVREKIPPAGYKVEFRDLVVDDAGSAWCAGWQILPGSGGDALVSKYSPRGRELWTRTWSDPPNRNEMYFSLALVGARSVFAVGDSVAPAGDYDAALIAYRR